MCNNFLRILRGEKLVGDPIGGGGGSTERLRLLAAARSREVCLERRERVVVSYSSEAEEVSCTLSRDRLRC